MRGLSRGGRMRRLEGLYGRMNATWERFLSDRDDIRDGASPYEDTEASEVPAELREPTLEDPHDAEGEASNPFAKQARGDQLPIPEKGSTIHDRYVVKTRLGGGAFGNVFKVEHRMLGQVFALKTLGGELGRDPQIISHFIEEAKATSLIGHENIVFVTDFGVCPTFGHYLVMEYLDGSSLEEILLESGPQSLEDAVSFVLSIGNALSAVHELGIVHRDLKPANVMRSSASRGAVWKVVDFGISSAVRKSGLSGTPTYMPPEQARGGEVDGRADQFALSVILYEMLSGEPPWETRSWLDALEEQRQQTKLVPLHQRRDDIPAAVDEALGRGLSLDLEDRFASMEAFVTAFKSACDLQHKPTMDPFDVRETTRHLEKSPKVEDTQSPRGEAFGPSRSVVTHVDDLSVAVTFQSLGRFKREYRRNIVAGGLFVPTRHPLPVRSFAWLRVGVSGHDKRAQVGCTVVSIDDGTGDSPPGFGVSLDDRSVRSVKTLLHTLESGFDNSPDAPIKVRRHLEDVSDGLNAAEAFFLSRIDPQMTVGRARAMFAALPFDFEETIQSLLKVGYIVVGDIDDSDVTDRAVGIESKKPFTPEELARVLERAEFFEHQHNYLGARELLDEAVRHAPDSARIHHRLARLRLRFEGNVRGAKESIDKALLLDPDNPEIRATRQLIEAISKRRH